MDAKRLYLRFLNLVRRSSRERRWLSCLAAAPFFLAVVFYAIGPRPQPLAAAASRPALAFEQYLVNLGNVEPRREHFARFGFTNTGDRSVRIKELKPSCGCLQPYLERTVLEPGESGEFFLRVQSATETPGKKTYTCKVFYEDPDPREAEVTFKLTLPEQTVTVEPKALIFYQMGDTEMTREIVVTDHRGGSLELTGVRCSTELADVHLNPPETDFDNTPRQTISVTVGHVPRGRHQGLLTISTDDPDFPELRVPLLIDTRDSR